MFYNSQEAMLFDAERSHTVPSLSWAVRAGDLNAIQQLLKNGRRPESNDNRGWTAIHNCAKFKQVAALELIFKYHRSITDHLTSLCTWLNETPLIIACTMNSIDVTMLEVLVSHGAQVNSRTVNGFTALHFAAQYKDNINAIKFLVEHGADVNKNEYLNGCTPLHLAIQETNDDDTIKYLVDKTQLNINNHSGQSPLFAACHSKNVNAVQMCLAKYRDNVNEEAESYTPLAIAAYKGCMEIVKLLLAAGADPNARSFTVPLHECVEHPDVFKLLLPLTDEENMIDSETSWPSFVTIRTETNATLEILLQHTFHHTQLNSCTLPEFIDYVLDNEYQLTGQLLLKFQNLFMYYLHLDPTAAFKYYLTVSHEEHFSVNFICLLIRMGISITCPELVIFRQLAVNFIEKYIKIGGRGIESPETAISSLNASVLTLKQLSRNTARTYFRNKASNDWEAYQMVLHSKLPLEIISFLLYQIL